MLVLGSNNCEYRIQHALEIGKFYPGIRYIVSGGNPYISGIGTEAEFMADYLKKNGINCTVRKEFGGDIDAACGQLRAKNIK